MIVALPGCQGCIYLDQDNTCGYWHKAKVTRTKLGIKTGRTGGCALYRGGGLETPGRSSTDYDYRVLELYQKGLDDPDIAAATGHSRAAIYGWRHRHGLPPNGKPGDKKKKKPLN